MNFYIKALGSTCYDEEGLTFPVEETLGKGLQHEVSTRLQFNGTVYWEHLWYMPNLPKVLLIHIDEVKNADLIEQTRSWVHEQSNGRLLFRDCRDW